MVACAKTLVSAIARVSAFINRSDGAFCPRNFNHKDFFAVGFENINALLQYDVMADFLTVVDKFPKSFLHFLGILQTVFDTKIAIAIFFNAQDNRAAVAICKR